MKFVIINGRVYKVIGDNLILLERLEEAEARFRVHYHVVNRYANKCSETRTVVEENVIYTVSDWAIEFVPPIDPKQKTAKVNYKKQRKRKKK